MEKKTLSSILEGKIFRIPDYQRGYAWEEEQWDDFIEDIDALIDDKITSHYTSTIVIYQPKEEKEKETERYGTRNLDIVDVIDGQQRLTTCSLYLSIIINQLIKSGKKTYEVDKINYLCFGLITKLKLNNDTNEYYSDLITRGSVNIKQITPHQDRLIRAYNYLQEHIIKKEKEYGIEYLIKIFDAILGKLHFAFYTIDKESEIGMTFEFMNSRGKGLTYLELLKNYFLYWIYRNIDVEEEKKELQK
jgi:uncharacterized protein with ParB-like and HNH nuclease domain